MGRVKLQGNLQRLKLLLLVISKSSHFPSPI